MRRRNPDPHVVAFCPFCRESYENTPFCPEHELELVSWEELPKMTLDSSSIATQDEALHGSLSMGRGWLITGALLLMTGFFVPAFVLDVDDVLMPSAYEMAMSRAPNLWTIPLVVFAVGVVVIRRRSQTKMRSARVALFVMAVMPFVSLGYTFFGVERWKTHYAPDATLHPSLGIWLCCVGTLLIAVGALRFGAPNAQRY